MPLPTPTSDESQSEFMSRCMGDDVMNDEYPDEKQRAAVCQAQWDKDNKSADMNIEKRYTGQPVAIEARAEDDGSRIEGYAAVFYDGTSKTEFTLWDGAVERIMPGAFDRAMKEDDVRALFNHNPDAILGRTAAGTLSLSADKTGLRYVIDPPDTSIGKDVTASVQRGDVTGSSFSFATTDVEWRKEDGVEIREIQGVKLYDVGPVTFPAYEATTTSARSEHKQWCDALEADIRRLMEADAEACRQREQAAIARRNRVRVIELGLTTGQKGT